MVDETMTQAPVEAEMPIEGEATAEATANPEEEAIAQAIQIIASLSPEAQRQLMGFLTEQFSAVIDEEQAEISASPEEQSRKADVMSEAF